MPGLIFYASGGSSVGSGGSRINVPSQLPTGNVLSFTESPGSPFLNSQAAPSVCHPLPILARAMNTGLRFSRDFACRVACSLMDIVHLHARGTYYCRI